MRHPGKVNAKRSTCQITISPSLLINFVNILIKLLHSTPYSRYSNNCVNTEYWFDYFEIPPETRERERAGETSLLPSENSKYPTNRSKLEHTDIATLVYRNYFHQACCFKWAVSVQNTCDDKLLQNSSYSIEKIGKKAEKFVKSWGNWCIGRVISEIGSNLNQSLISWLLCYSVISLIATFYFKR